MAGFTYIIIQKETSNVLLYESEAWFAASKLAAHQAQPQPVSVPVTPSLKPVHPLWLENNGKK